MILIDFLAKNGFKNPQSEFFSCKECPNKISTPNFNFEKKTIAAPPRAIHIKKFRAYGHVQNLSKGQKTGLVLTGNAFDSQLSSPANSVWSILFTKNGKGLTRHPPSVVQVIFE